MSDQIKERAAQLKTAGATVAPLRAQLTAVEDRRVGIEGRIESATRRVEPQQALLAEGPRRQRRGRSRKGARTWPAVVQRVVKTTLGPIGEAG